MNLSNGTETGWLVNNMGPFGANALFNGILAGHSANVDRGNIIVEDVITNDPRNDSEYRCVIRLQGTSTTVNESGPTFLYVAGELAYVATYVATHTNNFTVNIFK